MNDVATCRGCGRELDGAPYYLGGPAYDPITKERCKVNFYGGYVCSERCDYRASIELENSMPGSGPNSAALSCYARDSLNRNWKSP